MTGSSCVSNITTANALGRKSHGNHGINLVGLENSAFSSRKVNLKWCIRAHIVIINMIDSLEKGPIWPIQNWQSSGYIMREHLDHNFTSILFDYSNTRHSIWSLPLVRKSRPNPTHQRNVRAARKHSCGFTQRDVCFATCTWTSDITKHHHFSKE